MGVVDVEPGAVGQDDVGQRRVLGVGELARVGEVAVDLEAAGVAQRRLVLVVPAGLADPMTQRLGVGVDHLPAHDHRVGGRVARAG